MAVHNETGDVGEEYAVQYMIEKGYNILHRNWRFGHCEIDIIANNHDKLHFIEVKTRTNLKYGYPEEGVTKTKLKRLIKSANHFLHLNPNWKSIQFDVLSVIMWYGEDIEFLLFEDVYL